MVLFLPFDFFLKNKTEISLAQADIILREPLIFDKLIPDTSVNSLKMSGHLLDTVHDFVG